jgi:hypothetical protein
VSRYRISTYRTKSNASSIGWSIVVVAAGCMLLCLYLMAGG